MFSLLSVSVTFESALAREDEDGTNETLKKTKKKKRRSVRKLEFSPYGEVFYGKESNVFKSPDSIVNHPIYGTHTDIVKDDSFVETAVGLDVKGRLRKNKELTFEYNYEETKYAKYSILDEISTDIGFDYLQRMSKRSKIKLKTGYKQSDKISVDVFGLEYPYKISYESLTLNPILYHKYRPGIFGKHSGNTLMKLSYEMKSKNYAEPLPPNLSYDYVQDKITLDVTQEIDKTLDIKLGFDWRSRIYQVYLAKNRDGQANTDMITRNQNYFTLNAGFEKTYKNKSGFEFEYRYKTRDDLYQDYYSYTSNVLKGNAKYYLSPATSIQADFEYESRKYDIPALSSTGDISNPVQEYYDVFVGVFGDITSSTEISLKFVLDSRETNTDIEEKSTKRMYRDKILIAGIKIYL